jgi:hypothetical protein
MTNPNVTLNMIKRQIKLADANVPATFTVTLALVNAQDGKVMVDAQYKGNPQIMQKVNALIERDFLQLISEAANRSLPNENFDDEDYLNSSGLKQYFELEDNTGKQLVQLVEDGYNLLNEYVFDQPTLSIDEPTPFIELIFQANI